MKEYTKEEIKEAMEQYDKDMYNQKLLTKYYNGEITWKEAGEMWKK